MAYPVCGWGMSMAGVGALPRTTEAQLQRWGTAPAGVVEGWVVRWHLCPAGLTSPTLGGPLQTF